MGVATRSYERSLCKPGEELYKYFYSYVLKKEMVQYEYRTPSGDLFTCVTPTLNHARIKRNQWLLKRNK